MRPPPNEAAAQTAQEREADKAHGVEVTGARDRDAAGRADDHGGEVDPGGQRHRGEFGVGDEQLWHGALLGGGGRLPAHCGALGRVCTPLAGPCRWVACESAGSGLVSTLALLAVCTYPEREPRIVAKGHGFSHF